MKNKIARLSQIFSHSKYRNCILLALMGIFVLPCIGQAEAEKMVTTPSGLQYVDLVEGSGREAHAGDTATVHYTGRLLMERNLIAPKIETNRFLSPWEEVV